MASPSSSARFSVLPTNYLASQPPSSEITLQSLIDTSDRMAEEAREALPYSFDECTYNKGYLRQSVWSCLDCGEKGVCYGCSISCHAEHRLVELWTKRAFRCDCPTTSMQPEPSSASSKRRRCTLNPPEAQPQLPNEANSYSQNFAGRFCRCGRVYDAETETEAMLTCIACEDWFHETCLNLRPAVAIKAAPDKARAAADTDVKPPGEPMMSGTEPGPAVDEHENDKDEAEDEENSVLIRSETYDGLICAACVRGHHYLESKAGSEGWMIIEPAGDGSWEVIGRKQTVVGENGSKVGQKREAEGDDSGPETKKARVDNEEKEEGDSLRNDETKDSVWKWKGEGDIFLANGIREKLKIELDEKMIASLPFPLEDDEIYEPPNDDDEEETIEQVTNRVVSSLPRVQAIEALLGYQRLKDRLNDMLRSHVESGQTVSKADIDELFEQLKRRNE